VFYDGIASGLLLLYSFIYDLLPVQYVDDGNVITRPNASDLWLSGFWLANWRSTDSSNKCPIEFND